MMSRQKWWKKMVVKTMRMNGDAKGNGNRTKREWEKMKKNDDELGRQGEREQPLYT
jgi:hypothetical protein